MVLHRPVESTIQNGLFVIVFAASHRQIERKHAARVESGRYILQAGETANEKPRAD